MPNYTPETDLHSDLAGPKYPAAFEAKTSGILPAGSTNPGRKNAIKERFKQSRTSGNPMTQGDTKNAIGANQPTDPGRGLASAVREINKDDNQLISEPAIQTATKAFQGQREINQRVPSLNLKGKVGAMLKGGGTALGLGGSVMGAVDAKDQYGDMQEGPNYMDLNTGKVKKRPSGGLTGS